MQTILRVVAASEVALVILKRFLPIPGILPVSAHRVKDVCHPTLPIFCHPGNHDKRCG